MKGVGHESGGNAYHYLSEYEEHEWRGQSPTWHSEHLEKRPAQGSA